MIINFKMFENISELDDFFCIKKTFIEHDFNGDEIIYFLGYVGYDKHLLKFIVIYSDDGGYELDEINDLSDDYLNYDFNKIEKFIIDNIKQTFEIECNKYDALIKKYKENIKRYKNLKKFNI